MPNLTGRSLGRYTILEQLGVGGMATVYKAYDTLLERDVAIKVVRREVFSLLVLERVLKRFEREAKALAKLSHPNIVHIHDFGEVEGAPYLVMEYLPGGALKLQPGTPLPWQEAVKILLPVAGALAYAHEHNIIHRDVKPSNILLTEKGQPMLSDFGIAKILEREETQTLTGTGVGLGTPEYMPPEQWSGNVTPQSDIYSTGVVFYEMVTGRKPYTADTFAELLIKQTNEPLPRPHQFAPDLPAAVEKLLCKALARNPADRHHDMGEFIAALEALGDGHPVVKRKEGKESRGKGMGDKGTGDKKKEEETKTLLTPRRDKQPRRPVKWRRWAAMGWLAVLITLGTLVGRGLLNREPASPGVPAGPASRTLTSLLTDTSMPPSLTQTSSPSPTFTSSPSSTFTPTSTRTATMTRTRTRTPTPTVPPSPTLWPTLPAVAKIGSTWSRPADGMVMVYVPAGGFGMGNAKGDASEKPAHTVILEAYWIDKIEVTNGRYTKCVQAGACQPPYSLSSATRSSYYGNPQYSEYPVIHVDWNQARSYCEWAGGHLPSEAQWEKAARGTNGRMYPWGNTSPDGSSENFISKIEDTTTAGNFPAGASPYGALDMAANVWEWVADWYDSTYYAKSPENDPQGSASGQYRVLRGGAWGWGSTDPYLRATYRFWNLPEKSTDFTGFRCSRSAKP